MDIGLREWLVIIGVLIILAIIADGFRRYLGRSTLKFKLDRKLISQFSEDSGGSDILSPVRVAQPKEPVLGDDDLVERTEPEVFESMEPMHFDNEPLTDEQEEQEAPVLEPTVQQEEQSTSGDEITDIFIIYVESISPEGFKGPYLFQSVLESGMRFGDMDIFHRHESASNNSDKLFSMANALNPGVFDLDAMDDFSTRSLCFFMSLPGPKQPKQAFELMLTAARKRAHGLVCEL